MGSNPTPGTIRELGVCDLDWLVTGVGRAHRHGKQHTQLSSQDLELMADEVYALASPNS